MIVIRPAADFDIHALMSIKGDASLHQERLIQQEEGHAVYLLAVDESSSNHHSGSVIGHVFMLWNGDEYHLGYPILTDLWVRKTHRNHQIGTRLMERAEWMCHDRGLPQIGLSISPKANPRAHALYLRCGYVPADCPPHSVYSSHHDDEDNVRIDEEWRICMIKNLDLADAPLINSFA